MKSYKTPPKEGLASLGVGKDIEMGESNAPFLAPCISLIWLFL